MARPALQYFSIFFHKRHYFRGEKILNTKCVFWFRLQSLSETFLILRRNEKDTIKKYIGLNVKHPLLLSDFNETLISMKIRPGGAELLHADGQADTQT